MRSDWALTVVAVVFAVLAAIGTFGKVAEYQRCRDYYGQGVERCLNRVLQWK